MTGHRITYTQILSVEEKEGDYPCVWGKCRAERAHSRIYGEFRKIDLRYKAIKIELGEDLILNGENLFHFIYPGTPI